MTKNFELLWKIYDHIAAHPVEWTQGMWVTTYVGDSAKQLPVVLNVEIYDKQTTCGTAFCFAGHVAYAAGWNPIWSQSIREFRASWMKKDGVQRHVAEIAREELGLEPQEGWKLFDGNNTLQDIHGVITLWEAAQ